MKQVLVGYRPYDFSDDKTGRMVRGVTFFTLFDSNGVYGQEAGKVSYGGSVPENLSDYLGVEIDVEYGSVVRNGKVLVRSVSFPASVRAGGTGSGG